MNTQFQTKTLVRLVVVVIIAGVVTTILARPRADASDGYGVTAFVMASQPNLTEGRSAFTPPSLR